MNAAADPSAGFNYRAVFISDVHLGTRGCRSDFLGDFLSRMTCRHLFLVGDIVDFWQLRRSWHWDAGHDEILRLILAHARAGAGVVYVPGNHDEAFRSSTFLGLDIGGVQIRREAVHVTATGKNFLVLHGDEFDSVVCYARILAVLGDRAYSAALICNRWFNEMRRRFGYPYWSLSAWLKMRVKEAVKAIDRFEHAVTAEARRRGFDGVVCGHIHRAEMRAIGGTVYANGGDWVESCTALVEHHDGRLELINWAERQGVSVASSAAAGFGAAKPFPFPMRSN